MKKIGKLKLSKKVKIRIAIAFTALWVGLQINMLINYATSPSRDNTERAGDYLQAFIPAAGLTASFIIGDINGVLQFAAGCAANSIVTSTLKETIDAERPNGGGNSFPSGHTSYAFQGAAFILQRYGWKFGVFALLLACFVAFSRVEAKKHWTRDVIAGAAIGIACSYAFVRPFDKKDRLKNITVHR